MLDLRTTEKEMIATHIKEGDTVVDFTMGNGHDTLWLSKRVGESGKVYAFDIQEAALTSTRGLLEKEGAPNNYELICASHHRVEEFVEGPISAGMFNLGYLPGSDKTITTLHETTLLAIDAAVRLLAPGGGLLIAVYPGHAEGALEGQLITEKFAAYDRKQICVSQLKIVNSPTSPFFFLVEKR